MLVRRGGAVGEILAALDRVDRGWRRPRRRARRPTSGCGCGTAPPSGTAGSSAAARRRHGCSAVAASAMIGNRGRPGARDRGVEMEQRHQHRDTGHGLPGQPGQPVDRALVGLDELLGLAQCFGGNAGRLRRPGRNSSAISPRVGSFWAGETPRTEASTGEIGRHTRTIQRMLTIKKAWLRIFPRRNPGALHGTVLTPAALLCAAVGRDPSHPARHHAATVAGQPATHDGARQHAARPVHVRRRGRIVVRNRPYLAMYNLAPEVVKPGCTLEI